MTAGAPELLDAIREAVTKIAKDTGMRALLETNGHDVTGLMDNVARLAIVYAKEVGKKMKEDEEGRIQHLKAKVLAEDYVTISGLKEGEDWTSTLKDLLPKNVRWQCENAGPTSVKVKFVDDSRRSVSQVLAESKRWNPPLKATPVNTEHMTEVQTLLEETKKELEEGGAKDLTIIGASIVQNRMEVCRYVSAIKQVVKKNDPDQGEDADREKAKTKEIKDAKVKATEHELGPCFRCYNMGHHARNCNLPPAAWGPGTGGRPPYNRSFGQPHHAGRGPRGDRPYWMGR